MAIYVSRGADSGLRARSDLQRVNTGLAIIGHRVRCRQFIRFLFRRGDWPKADDHVGGLHDAHWHGQ